MHAVLLHEIGSRAELTFKVGEVYCAQSHDFTMKCRIGGCKSLKVLGLKSPAAFGLSARVCFVVAGRIPH